MNMSMRVSLPFSGQLAAVYQILLKGNSLSARDIACELSIYPNAVYRELKVLIDIGLIEELNTYPLSFKMIPFQEAVENYLLFSKNNFLQNFLPKDKLNTNVKTNEELMISFTKTRSELINRINYDINKAQISIDHIVSGLELPAEVMLLYKKALDRRVKLRFLVQNTNEVNNDIINNWKRMGLEVRYSSLFNTRIIIFDSKITYLASYDPKNREEANGVRFSYAPIAKQINDLFEVKWTTAQPLNNI